MNLKKLSALFVGFIIAVGVSAQSKVFFVEDVTEAGEPVGHSAAWSISQTDGGNIYVLYTNNKKPINYEQMGIKLEKKNSSGTYEAYDELTAAPEKGKTWVMFEVPFAENGDYKVSVTDAAGKVLAFGELEIIYAESGEVVEDITEEHAKGYKLTFCDSLDEDGMPISEKTEFARKRGEANVILHVYHEGTLKASKLTLRITQGGKNPEDIEMACEPGSYGLYYEKTFFKAGTYEVALISPSGKKLNFGIVKVK